MQATLAAIAGAFMSKIPDDVRYTENHEWARISGNRATVGITDHAQAELTDVVYVELPKTGKFVKAGELLGVIESVKAVSEIYSPVTGKVIEANRELEASPEAINKDPYGKGWIAVLEVADPKEFSGLMDAAAYRRHIGE